MGEDRKPWNWTGEPVIASNGYVLIHVGKDHHLADVRGYAYQHRLVAEGKLGRKLNPGEIVHHIDGNKQNNTPDNLEICDGNAEHFLHHRKRDLGRRMPGEENPAIECQCGCGSTFNKFDDFGRPRSFVSGHNPMPSPTKDAVLAAIGREPTAAADIVASSGVGASKAKAAMTKLKRAGLVENVSYGFWRRVG